ncbi:cytochrome P450 [Geminocystis sp. GBBB08]|uniref:cytochrome P450 n=1 Tax=Geminocystis sp. GBBB08 TaxID=2604140 RepID=UPI0027E2B2E8|nr:cytochrome P450 [Geminocystis sp. GBBB08]MBL1208406.1 cytochrome P450 [Geminocystis sp. GBBB08]
MTKKLPPNYLLPPGSFGLPIIGETLNFISDPNFGDKKQAQYGSIFKTNILGKPTVMMCGAQANRFILQTHFDHFSWEKGWPKTFHELLGRSLFLQDGDEHKRNRKLLMPSFHGSALNNYFDTMLNIIQSYLEKWEKQKNFTWFTELKQMTFEIASVLLLGSERGENITYLSKLFSQLSSGLFSFPINILGTKYHKALKSRDLLLSHLEKEILKRQEKPKNDALGLLIQTKDEEGNGLSIEEIKLQALLMLFAGHETTTSMLTSLCLALSQNIDVLSKAKEEQNKLNQEDNLNLNQLKQMPYLDQVLKEVERLYPPVGGGFRGVVKPFVFNGYYVPEGWQVLYRIESTHKDKNIYSDPLFFDPERFNKEREEHKKIDFSLVGFGGGSRFCLGYAFAQMEMKIFASLLLRNYTWQLAKNQNLSLDNIPSLHPKSGLKIVNLSRI